MEYCCPNLDKTPHKNGVYFFGEASFVIIDFINYGSEVLCSDVIRVNGYWKD
jgi:hypothetical protein